MKAVVYVVGLGTLFSVGALAGETGTIAAALPDEASECRYLARLCDEAREAEKAVDAEAVRYAAAKKRADQMKPGSWPALADAGRAMEPKVLRYRRTRNDAIEAAKVVMAKHAKAPECVCWDVVGREQR